MDSTAAVFPASIVSRLVHRRVNSSRSYVSTMCERDRECVSVREEVYMRGKHERKT